MAHSLCLSQDSRHSYSVGLFTLFSSHDCSRPLAPRKSFDILALYKSDYYYYYYLARSVIKSHATERALKIWGFPSIFTQWLKLATSNFVHILSLPKPSIKPQPEEKWAWAWVREALIYLEFPFTISATGALSS